MPSDRTATESLCQPNTDLLALHRIQMQATSTTTHVVIHVNTYTAFILLVLQLLLYPPDGNAGLPGQLNVIVVGFITVGFKCGGKPGCAGRGMFTQAAAALVPL